MTTRSLRNGKFNVLGQAIDPANPLRPKLHVTPRAKLGRVIVRVPKGSNQG